MAQLQGWKGRELQMYLLLRKYHIAHIGASAYDLQFMRRARQLSAIYSSQPFRELLESLYGSYPQKTTPKTPPNRCKFQVWLR